MCQRLILILKRVHREPWEKGLVRRIIIPPSPLCRGSALNCLINSFYRAAETFRLADRVGIQHWRFFPPRDSVRGEEFGNFYRTAEQLLWELYSGQTFSS